ncbi:tryptophan dimethylallyltransferase-domain-containing protein, partial [Aspergillus recurvatus]
YVQEAAAGAHFTTTVVVASEWTASGLRMKTYFVPRRLGQSDTLPMAEWEEAISQLVPDCASRAAMHDFLESSPEGRMLKPYMVAVDNVSPDRSRLKLYFHTPHTSFASVREIMTLGGRVAVPEAQLQELRTLISAVSGLATDFPESQEVPCSEDYHPSARENFAEMSMLLAGYIYYFDIAPGRALPDIKFYTPVRRYGPDDAALAEGITGWMAAQNRGQYCQRYKSMLKSLTPHRQLEEGKGIQTYVSCLLKKSGGLEVTSYIGPEAFDPVRLSSRSVTG